MRYSSQRSVKPKVFTTPSLVREEGNGLPGLLGLVDRQPLSHLNGLFLDLAEFDPREIFNIWSDVWV